MDEFPEGSAFARQIGHRSIVSVPLLREGVAIGATALRRAEVQPFAEKQIDLLKTFADQAVIAIENVRLLNETKEALEQQTASSEILRVISSSPTDEQPVFDAIARSALHLLKGHSAGVRLLVSDELHIRAFTSTDVGGDKAVVRLSVIPLSGSPFFTQVVRGRMTAVVEDMETDPRIPPDGRALGRARGFRSAIAIPLLREQSVLGVINVTRRQPGPFSRDEIALLQTFADQAVIAIENVRLFTELQEKNRALTEAHAQVTEALEQQTATANILRIISSSPTDVQPVLGAIAERAVRLCGGYFSRVALADGEWVHIRATYNVPPEWQLEAGQAYPAPLASDLRIPTSIREGRLIHILDMQGDSELLEVSRQRARIAATAPGQPSP